MRIAVTDLEYDKGREVFEAAPPGYECLRAPAAERELTDMIRASGARHAIVGVQRYVGPLYEALPPGGVIARFGVGHDGIDKALAARHGLLCTNTPGVLEDSVAEHAIALLLAVARHIPALASATRAGQWAPRMGRELHGARLAVIGCGPIGRRVAHIAARGLGMAVVGCEIRPVDQAAVKGEFGFAEIRPDFAAAAATADYVSLHLPANASTMGYLNRERLAVLRPQAFVINTARGSLVDEEALFDALAAGRLAGAALDVFAEEPYRPATPGKDLRTLDNVILTPHVASSTREACLRMARRALRNIELAETGRVTEMDLVGKS